ncbi:MAG: hypothetical protein QF785_02750 [Phycisphaeraceae bacterium]|nr:hypothetical protein [Phycisphaeraceae bacterium]
MRFDAATRLVTLLAQCPPTTTKLRARADQRSMHLDKHLPGLHLGHVLFNKPNVPVALQRGGKSPGRH